MVICLGCNKEGHSIQNCFKLFYQKKEGGDRQNQCFKSRRDRKPRSKRERAMFAKQHTKMDYSSGGESNSESENDEVINLALMATHGSEASSSSLAVKVRLTPELNKYECDNDSLSKCESTSDSNIFLDEGLISKVDTRLKTMLDESDSILIKKDDTIKNLKSEIL